MDKNYDVIVAGGGIAGTVAAISAARNGCAVLLVEQYGFLGGMLTAASVGPMMTFHAGNTQAVRGITGEIVERLAANGKSPGHIFDSTGYTYTVTPFDIEGMKRELELMLLEAGGEILYHTMVADVERSGSRVKELLVCNKGGLSRIGGRVFVDATADGDLAKWAGLEYIFGNSQGVAQPMTLMMKMHNVDIGRIKGYIRENPEDFRRIHHDLGIIDRSPRLSLGGFEKTFEAARKNGEISMNGGEVLFFETNNPGEVIVNTTRVQGYDGTDPFSLSRAETEGRRQAFELEGFLKRRVPGFEKAVVLSTGPAIGVRSSRQIKGMYTLTFEDVATCRRFDDTIAHGGYPVDVHPSKDGYTDETRSLMDKYGTHPKWGRVFSIPYRCLVTDAMDNLITVGRCISATFEAQGAIRVAPIAGAIGHGGGAAASIAAKTGQKVSQIDLRDLKQLLTEQKAYLEE